jgi:hypothetical protein
LHRRNTRLLELNPQLDSALSCGNGSDRPMLARVENITECEGKICSEQRFYRSLAQLSAKQFAEAVRAH